MGLTNPRRSLSSLPVPVQEVHPASGVTDPVQQHNNLVCFSHIQQFKSIKQDRKRLKGKIRAAEKFIAANLPSNQDLILSFKINFKLYT